MLLSTFENSKVINLADYNKIIWKFIKYFDATNEFFSLCSNQLGALAVTIRQTNIIWMLFVACTGVIDITLANKRDDEKVEDSYVSSRTNDRLTSTSRVTMGSNLRKRKSDGDVDKSDMSMPRTSTFSTTQKSGSVSHI